MKQSASIAILCMLITTITVAGDESDELIVSTTRAENTKIPGAILKRPADFLLQRIKVSSDSRDEKTRKDEIFDTLRLIVAASTKDKSLELAITLDNRVVVPLKLDAATLKLARGSRADTSEAYISVKTKALTGVSNAVALYAKLKEFPSTIKPAGRAVVDLYGDVDVSIVNPAQYREQVIRLYAADAKMVTTALGPDYRVVTKGIDRQLQWMRDGMTDVVIFIPYEYDVIPVNAGSVGRTGN